MSALTLGWKRLWASCIHIRQCIRPCLTNITCKTHFGHHILRKFACNFFIILIHMKFNSLHRILFFAFFLFLHYLLVEYLMQFMLLKIQIFGQMSVFLSLVLMGMSFVRVLKELEMLRLLLQ